MKINEILSLSKEKRLDVISKEYLDIGEKNTRKALKAAGGYYESGKRGWSFNGPTENLEKSIYEFIDLARKRDVTVKVKKETKENPVSTVTVEKNTKEPQRKRASFDIDKELLKTLKLKSVMEEKHVYELVEDAIRSYVKKTS